MLLQLCRALTQSRASAQQYFEVGRRTSHPAPSWSPPPQRLTAQECVYSCSPALPSWPFSNVAKKRFLIPQANPVDGLGEAQNTHPDFIDAISYQILGGMCPSGDGSLMVVLLIYHERRQAGPAPTDEGRSLARALGLTLKRCIVPVLTNSFLSSFCYCWHEHQGALALWRCKEPFCFLPYRCMSL